MLTETYLGFFKAVAEGNCIDESNASVRHIFDQVGFSNTELTPKWGDALKELIEAVNTPGCKDFQAKVDRYIEVAFEFFRSQPGLKSFPKSKKLRKNPKNKEFFDIVDEVLANIRSIPSNPEAAKAMFNEETAAVFAHAMFLSSKLVTDCSSSESS
jgi:hypothetical protein